VHVRQGNATPRSSRTAPPGATLDLATLGA
jgi:hypothetical protein